MCYHHYKEDPAITVCTGLTTAKLFALVFVSALALGLIILIASGISHVKDGETIVTERALRFRHILHKGWHYVIPFVENRVGRYSLSPTTVEAAFAAYRVRLTYRIVDPKAYHYAGHDFTARLSAILDKTGADRAEEAITGLADRYGIEVIAVEILTSGGFNGH